MAEEAKSRNERLLRAGIDAYNRGDFGWVYAHAADDIEVEVDPGLLNTGHHRGKPAFERWLVDWQEAWSEMEIEILALEQVDERFLLVDVLQRGTGAASGVPTVMELVQLIEVAGGAIARFHLYPDRERALEALARNRAAAPAGPDGSSAGAPD